MPEVDPRWKGTSPKKIPNRIPDNVKNHVRYRSGGRCERCTDRRAEPEMHHRLMRSQGGGHTYENLVDLCTACHRWVHANPTAAYEAGLLIRSWAGMPEEVWNAGQEVPN